MKEQIKFIESEIINLLKDKENINGIFYDDFQKLIRFNFNKYEMTISVEAQEMSYDVLISKNLI